MATRLTQVSPSFKCAASTTDRNPAISDRRAPGTPVSERSLASIDVLAVCTSPTLSIYLSGLLQPFRWSLEEVRTVAGALEMLWEHRTAVVVCEATLQDASWTDLAGHLRLLPMAPLLVVVEDSGVSAGEVDALGGFGTLSTPLCEPDVIWTLASAWHTWMSGIEARHPAGGVTCSGG